MPAVKDLKGKVLAQFDAHGGPVVLKAEEPEEPLGGRPMRPAPAVSLSAPAGTEAVLKAIAGEITAIREAGLRLAHLADDLRRAVSADLDKQGVITKLAEAVSQLQSHERSAHEHSGLSADSSGREP